MMHRILAATAVAVALAVPARAETPAEFYADKNVTVMVPSSLGGTLGLYGQLLVDHLGKHIPGKPNVIINSRPGGGGVVGASFAYNAGAKDGTLIAQVLAPSVLVPLLREAKFDASKFQWIGSQVPRPGVISLWRGSGITSLDMAKSQEVIMGSSGAGSETYFAPTLMNMIAGTKFKVVKGYKGGAEINQAMEQGEVHGRMQYWSGWTAGKPDWLRDNKLVHLAKYGGKIPELNGVPDMLELAETDEQKAMVRFLAVASQVGMGYWVPPEVPADRVAALRKAFADTMKDPEFLAAAEKRKAPIDYVTPEELTETVTTVYKTPKDTIEKLKEVFGG